MTSRLELCSMVAVAIFFSACAAPVAPPVTSAGPEPHASTPPPATAGIPPGRVRASVVAGSWYPDDPAELAQMVDEMLEAVEPVDGAPVGLIVPHAGYVYSGQVTAVGFRQLAEDRYDTAVIIASDHRPPLSDPISVWAGGGFETPLGVVPVDVALAEALIDADERIVFEPATHEGEHPIEIELPFLQRVCPGCSIVPVLMGAEDKGTVQALAEALVSVVSEKRIVVIASSDLSHYPAYDDALAVDGATLEAIETFEPTRVRETTAKTMARDVSNLMTCACGKGPILVTMQVAAGLGAETATILHYANSGDVSGDHSRVVGYGAVMFWHYEPPDLTEAQRKELLSLARLAIATYLESGHLPDYEPDDPVLARKSGIFVTLKDRGELRGCIGHTRASRPLYEVVQEMAVAAATNDPRFPPLTTEELGNLTVEISILSPLRRMTDVTQVEVGTHGLMIFKGGQRGLLLPQVPVEQGWDRQEYLDNLCFKAGLPARCWQEQAVLYAFTAVVFGE